MQFLCQTMEKNVKIFSMTDILSSIQNFCIEQRLTLSVAESCTGGRLSARLTSLPGSSQYFLGGVVAYSNGAKKSLLGVDESLIIEQGSVSGPVVCQMAEGVLRLTGSHYSLAVSGIAGPGGGSPSKPIGTIWGAIGCKDKETVVWNFMLSGNRKEIVEQATEILLCQLWRAINC